MPKLSGWLSEDHFGYGHLQIEVKDILWSKHFLSYTDAANEAFRLRIISPLQMTSLRYPNRPQRIMLVIEDKISAAKLRKERFTPLKMT